MENLISRKWIQGEPVDIDPLKGYIFTGEASAHTFRITAESISGGIIPITGEITGTFLNPHGDTVPLEGSLENGVAVLTLTEECYYVAGIFTLSIFVTDAETTTCIYCGIGKAYRTDGQCIIYPSATLPNIAQLLSQVQTAIGSVPTDYSDLLETIAPNYADLTFPVVINNLCWYNGVLYQANTDISESENWTASHWDEVTIGEILSAFSALHSEKTASGNLMVIEDADGTDSEIVVDPTEMTYPGLSINGPTVMEEQKLVVCNRNLYKGEPSAEFVSQSGVSSNWALSVTFDGILPPGTYKLSYHYKGWFPSTRSITSYSRYKNGYWESMQSMSSPINNTFSKIDEDIEDTIVLQYPYGGFTYHFFTTGFTHIGTTQYVTNIMLRPAAIEDNTYLPHNATVHEVDNAETGNSVEDVLAPGQNIIYCGSGLLHITYVAEKYATKAELNQVQALAKYSKEVGDSLKEAVSAVTDEAAIAAALLNGTYEGVDLTIKFETEIADYTDKWAWIKARIQAGNYDGIHVADYIPFTANDNDYKAIVMGINTYSGFSYDNDNVVGNHIDFIFDKAWATQIQFNSVNRNNGVMDSNTPSAIYPWLCSKMYAYINSLQHKIINSATYPMSMTTVSYTSSGIYYYLPEELKNVIIEKIGNIPKRYDSSGFVTDDTSWGTEYIGKLWLPTETEVFGRAILSSHGNGEIGMVQYPLFSLSPKHLRLGNDMRWYTMSPTSGVSTGFVSINENGSVSNSVANNQNTYYRTRPCFRIG